MMTVAVEPTFWRIPDGAEDAGKDCVELARAYGVGLDEWQADIIIGALRESNGNWSASQVGLVVARQSGKGQILLALELYGLVVLGENILHTAHAVKTSSDAFRRLWAVIQSHSDLAGKVHRHSQMIGAEYVELASGARIAFTTRSASAGRGLSVDRLIVDEAEDLPAAEVGALAPTVFARPQAQSLYFGTAPGPMHDAEAFGTLRRSAHDGLNPRLAWFEWCAEWGVDDEDRELWVRVNPAVAAGRVPIQAIEDDKAVLPLDQFRAERLSKWPPPRVQAAALFDAEVWASLCDPDSGPARKVSIGVDAPPSRETATVCVAGIRPDGKLHIEWYVTREGVTWLPEWLPPRIGERVRAVVVDERGPLAEVDWKAASVRPTLIDARDVANAAGAVVDRVTDGVLRHRGQTELTRAVLGARQRPMLGGNGFAWDRKAPGSSVLIAASLALHGVEAQRVKRPVVREEEERRAVVLR